MSKGHRSLHTRSCPSKRLASPVENWEVSPGWNNEDAMTIHIKIGSGARFAISSAMRRRRSIFFWTFLRLWIFSSFFLSFSSTSEKRISVFASPLFFFFFDVRLDDRWAGLEMIFASDHFRSLNDLSGSPLQSYPFTLRFAHHLWLTH